MKRPLVLNSHHLLEGPGFSPSAFPRTRLIHKPRRGIITDLHNMHMAIPHHPSLRLASLSQLVHKSSHLCELLDNLHTQDCLLRCPKTSHPNIPSSMSSMNGRRWFLNQMKIPDHSKRVLSGSPSGFRTHSHTSVSLAQPPGQKVRLGADVTLKIRSTIRIKVPPWQNLQLLRFPCARVCLQSQICRCQGVVLSDRHQEWRWRYTMDVSHRIIDAHELDTAQQRQLGFGVEKMSTNVVFYLLTVTLFSQFGGACPSSIKKW